jgi:hypothetical protein
MERVPHEANPAIHIERPGRLAAYVDDVSGVLLTWLDSKPSQSPPT